jgi:hypothetical protein
LIPITAIGCNHSKTKFARQGSKQALRLTVNLFICIGHWAEKFLSGNPPLVGGAKVIEQLATDLRA